MKNKPVFIIYFVMAAAFLWLDRFLKNLVMANMEIGDAFPSQDSFFAIRFVINTGASFNFFSGHTEALIILQSALFAIVIVACIVTYRKLRHPVLQTGLVWIVTGGLGNLIDRIMYGYVIDFISVGTFPVWNFADMCIVGGCILLGIYILFIYGKDKKTPKALPDVESDE